MAESGLDLGGTDVDAAGENQRRIDAAPDQRH
jgi:hypothetical protein